MANKHVITKTVEKEIWTNALTDSFNKNVKEVKVDGFRKGKCPRNIYEKKYGVESLYNDAINFALPSLYSETLKESKLIPVVQPTIDIKNVDATKLEVEFTIVTAPVVKIKKYKSLGVKKEKAKVTKEDIKEEIERIKNQYAEVVVKDGAIENGDTAVIDFEGFKDDVPFEGGKGENYPLEIGSNTFIPGFESQLIGLKTNDKKDIKVTFPEDYPSVDLKNKEVVFKVLVHEVKGRSIPELNEDFFKDLGIEGVNSLETLENHAKEDLEERKDKELDNKFVNDILEAVAKQTEVELPEELVHEEIHHMIDNYSQRLQMQGITLDQFLKMTNTTMEKLEEQLEDEAKKNVTYRYMLEEIAKLEKIEISDEDANKEADKLAEMYQMSKEEVVNAFGGVDMIKYDQKMKRTIDFLKENN